MCDAVSIIAIIRSYDYWCFMKDKLVKVKRKRVDWVKVLFGLYNDAMHGYFFSLFRKLRKGKSMSINRCAYNTIRHFYSTTTIDETLEKLGL